MASRQVTINIRSTAELKALDALIAKIGEIQKALDDLNSAAKTALKKFAFFSLVNIFKTERYEEHIN